METGRAAEDPAAGETPEADALDGQSDVVSETGDTAADDALHPVDTVAADDAPQPSAAQSEQAATSDPVEPPSGNDALQDRAQSDADPAPARAETLSDHAEPAASEQAQTAPDDADPSLAPATTTPVQSEIAPADETPVTDQAQTEPADAAPEPAQAEIAPVQSEASDPVEAEPSVERVDTPSADTDEAAVETEARDPVVVEPVAEQPDASPAEAEITPVQADHPTPSDAETAPLQAETATEPAQAQTLPADSAPDASEEPAAEAAAAQPEPSEPEIDPKDVRLTIATWSGAYGQAQDRAVLRPFAQRYGYQLETKTYDGDYTALEAQSDEPTWNLVDLNGEALTQACAEGRLERLDESIVEPAPDGRPLSDDMLPGAIHPCGVASMAWSAVVVYDSRIAAKPASIADFFDTGRIPGKRLLPKQPRYSLELALLADGVAPEEVYATLQTRTGQDRAFRKLSSIKDDIVWWEKPSEVFGPIADKDAVMGLGFNGRAFMAIVASKLPLEILWDRQIFTYDYWAIPAGAPHQKPAKDFIRFATSPGPLADQASWIPYGPSRRSALQLVGRQVELDIDMKPYLPTHEPNFAGALQFDGAFWRENGAALQARFADWVLGRQLPVQKEAHALP